MQGWSQVVTDGRTAYLDTKVPVRVLPLVRQSLLANLQQPDELVLGIFAVTRFRRAVSVLVVTDRRLLTLGLEHDGLPVVDDVLRADVTEVHVEREKIFSTGQVTAHTVHGEVNLGMLVYDDTTFIRLEEALAAKVDGALPVIPTPTGLDVSSGVEDGWAPEDGPTGPSASTHPPSLSTHPLVVHLTALADLHERGALTDEEFTTAKARLLADPEG